MCPADFMNIRAGVKRWLRRLRGKGNDKDHSDFMVSTFQGHMEDGLFHLPVADVPDIYDRTLLQWGSLLDRKRNELRDYFPSQTIAGGVNVPVTDHNTKTGTSVHKNTPKQGQRHPKTALPREHQQLQRTSECCRFRNLNLSSLTRLEVFANSHY